MLTSLLFQLVLVTCELNLVVRAFNFFKVVGAVGVLYPFIS